MPKDLSFSLNAQLFDDVVHSYFLLQGKEVSVCYF